MIFFLLILVVALFLIYFNVYSIASGKVGRLIALGILLLIFIGMYFRDSFIGAILVSFSSVWLCQALLIYILWGIFRILRRCIKRTPLNAFTIKKISRILFAITIQITIVFFAYGVPHNADYKIVEKHVKLSQSAENFTVVFFSDIHIDPLFKREKLERFIAHVDSISPDYLLFGGDLADVSSAKLDLWGYDSLFKKLTSKAKIASIGINGNHEAMQERSGSNPNEWMRKVGFIVLDDSSICIQKACFTGRTDFQVANSRGIERVPLNKLSVEKIFPWILLDHQPKGIESDYSGRLPDFAFSGHTHNGQFFPGNLLINLFWRLAYGEGFLDGVHWFVSSGIDTWGPPVRVGTDADIWVVHFGNPQLSKNPTDKKFNSLI